MKSIRKFCFILIILSFMMPCLSASGVEKGYTVFHGDRDKPKIAITVDDCYNKKHVQAILDLCLTYDVPITFFVIGSALKYADQPLWQAVIDAGCEIGNHTWTHRRLPDLSDTDIAYQLGRTEEKLDDLLGYHYPMQIMRPPYGTLSNDPSLMSELRVVEAIEEAGYLHAICWDVSQTHAGKALKQTQNGSILLFHANAKDVRCLKKLLPALLKEGYECVTVSRLLDLTT